MLSICVYYLFRLKGSNAWMYRTKVTLVGADCYTKILRPPCKLSTKVDTDIYPFQYRQQNKLRLRTGKHDIAAFPSGAFPTKLQWRGGHPIN